MESMLDQAMPVSKSPAPHHLWRKHHDEYGTIQKFCISMFQRFGLTHVNACQCNSIPCTIAKQIYRSLDMYIHVMFEFHQLVSSVHSAFHVLEAPSVQLAAIRDIWCCWTRANSWWSQKDPFHYAQTACHATHATAMATPRLKGDDSESEVVTKLDLTDHLTKGSLLF